MRIYFKMDIKIIKRLVPSKENHFAKIDKEMFAGAGIYLLWNEKYELIYIGKAKNIRGRILSHVSEDNKKLIDSIDDYGYGNYGGIASYLDPAEIIYYSYIPVESERDRIIFELLLIHILKPKYNFLSKSELLGDASTHKKGAKG